MSSTELVPTTYTWLQSLELGYEQQQVPQQSKEEQSLDKKSCWYCGNSSSPLSTCSNCHVAKYCTRDCQVADWKKSKDGGIGHKHTCPALKRVGVKLQITAADDQASARQDIIFRIRFYACPYAVHKMMTLGRGFLFLQGTCSLAEMSLPSGTSIFLPQKSRSVLLHYLTLGEFDSEVCRDDFELAAVRDALKQAVDTYDCEKHMVVLMRFRCGHLSVGLAPLVPDYGLSRSLGQQYYGSGEGASSGALQLNLDDM